MKMKTKMHTKMQKGFTLIELMITVAIVGILAAVALPAYQDYTIRAQASEGIILAEGAKTAVAEYHADKGTFPDSNTDAGFSGASGKYVSGVEIGERGVIVASFGSGANTNLQAETITLEPGESASGNVTWTCKSSAARKYLPTSCQSEEATPEE